MGWAARAKVRSGNPKTLVSTKGRLIAGGGDPIRQKRIKVRGKAAVKAAKRARRYDESGRRIRSINL